MQILLRDLVIANNHDFQAVACVPVKASVICPRNQRRDVEGERVKVVHQQEFHQMFGSKRGEFKRGNEAPMDIVPTTALPSFDQDFVSAHRLNLRENDSEDMEDLEYFEPITTDLSQLITKTFSPDCHDLSSEKTDEPATLAAMDLQQQQQPRTPSKRPIKRQRRRRNFPPGEAQYEVVSGWSRTIFNSFLLLTAFVMVVASIFMFWGDYTLKYTQKQRQMLAKVDSCNQKFIVNKCQSPLPALVELCKEWLACSMESDTVHISSWKIFAEMLAETIDAFSLQVSVKSLMTLTLFALVAAWFIRLTRPGNAAIKNS